ncbi:MAG: PLDc N-terminal domain-containing protein [Desulfobacterales bacterium]
METVAAWIKIGFVFLILTFLAILDVARKDFGTIKKKAVWGFVALVPFIGWLLYLVFGFRKGKKPDKEGSGK